MKTKLFVAMAALVCFHASYSQNTFPASGNVGAGTTTPTEALEIKGASKNLLISNTADTESGILFKDFDTPAKNAKFVYNSSLNSLALYGGTKKMLSFSLGNTGLGGTDSYVLGNASYPVHQTIFASSSGTGGQGYSTHFPAFTLNGTGTNAGKFLQMGVHGDPWIGAASTYPIQPGMEHRLRFSTNVKINPFQDYYDLFDIINSGVTILDVNKDKTYFNTKIGIGTNTFPLNEEFNLYVKGGIRTEKIKVDLSAANLWGDFVFSKNYALRSLEEVETFVKENNHLPEIPSATEIEAGGLDLGEMQRLQMIKIEELTLYMIEMKKEINALKKENDQLKSKISQE